MAYDKKYAELGESVIDYVNNREDAIEAAFEYAGIRKVSLTRTLDNAAYTTFTDGYPLIVAVTDVGDTGVPFGIDIGHAFQNRASGGFLIAFRDNRTGTRLGNKTLSFDVYYIK